MEKDLIEKIKELVLIDLNNVNLPNKGFIAGDCLGILFYKRYLKFVKNQSLEVETKELKIYSEKFNIEELSFNCEQIGHDLTSKEFVITQNYLQFLESNQIDVNYWYDYNFIPYDVFQKIKLFSTAFCNVEKIIDFTAYLYNEFDDIDKKLINIDKLNEKEKNILKKYLYDNEFHTTIKIDLNNYLKGTHNVYKLYKLLFGYGVKKAQIDVYKEFIKYEHVGYSLLEQDNYLETWNNLPANWKNYLKGIEDLLNEHYELRCLFYKKNFVKQINLYKYIKEKEKQYGTWVVGLFEDRLDILHDDPNENTEIILKDLLSKITEIIIDPLPITNEKMGCKIVELVTRKQLLEEGNYNRHCVGGYTPTVYRRIFSIRYQKYRFTTEFYYKPIKDKWVLVQCKGFQNKNPSFFVEVEKKIIYVVTWLSNIINEKFKPLDKESF